MKNHFITYMHSTKQVRRFLQPISCNLPKKAWVFFWFIFLRVTLITEKRKPHNGCQAAQSKLSHVKKEIVIKILLEAGSFYKREIFWYNCISSFNIVVSLTC